MIAIGTATLALTGCDGDSRLAEQAEQHSRQQAEQSLRMAHLQQEVVDLQKEVQIGQHDLSHERDKLEEERRRFATARIVDPVIASAISMAAVLLTGGTKDKRAALPHSRIMIHQPLGKAQGQMADMEITVKQIIAIGEDLYAILAKHTGQPLDTIRKDANRDYWMRASEAQTYGLIDNVLLRN